VSNSLAASSYPFLCVICNNNIGGMTVLDRIEGYISAEDLMARLTTVLEMNGSILTSARLDTEERERDRTIREEQDIEFLRSIQEDQEKERKVHEEEQQIKQEKERIYHEEEMKRKRQMEKEKKKEILQKDLPSEPTIGEKGITHLIIRLTDGSKLQRRFRITDKLQVVLNFIELTGTEHGDYDLVSNFPKKVFSDPSITLEQASLFPQASLFVQQK